MRDDVISLASRTINSCHALVRLRIILLARGTINSCHALVCLRVVLLALRTIDRYALVCLCVELLTLRTLDRRLLGLRRHALALCDDKCLPRRANVWHLSRSLRNGTSAKALRAEQKQRTKER